jgi:predicted GNAT family acetyltransferase
MAEYQVVNNEADGRFEIHADGHVAFTEYRGTDEGLYFPHTLVPKELEGRGLGGALAKAGLEFVRAELQKILPGCTFIAGYITRHPEHHDLVHPTYRAKLHLDDPELEEELLGTFPASDPPTITRRES